MEHQKVGLRPSHGGNGCHQHREDEASNYWEVVRTKRLAAEDILRVCTLLSVWYLLKHEHRHLLYCFEGSLSLVFLCPLLEMARCLYLSALQIHV